MFRRYRIWRAEKALGAAQDDLYTWGHESVKHQEECLALIVYAKRSADHSWSQPSFDGETNEMLYRLFMHQQYTGYLVENVRKKTLALGLLNPALSKKVWEIGEDLGGQGNNSQGSLYKEFVINILPRLEQVERKMFRHLDD